MIKVVYANCAILIQNQLSLPHSLELHFNVHQNLIVLIHFSEYTLFLNQPNLTDPVEQWVETPLDAMATGSVFVCPVFYSFCFHRVHFHNCIFFWLPLVPFDNA